MCSCRQEEIRKNSTVIASEVPILYTDINADVSHSIKFEDNREESDVRGNKERRIFGVKIINERRGIELKANAYKIVEKH